MENYKSQIPNFKQIPITEIQNPKHGISSIYLFWSFEFRICVLFAICLLVFGILCYKYLDIDAWCFAVIIPKWKK
jgi:hypothetical protein